MIDHYEHISRDWKSSSSLEHVTVSKEGLLQVNKSSALSSLCIMIIIVAFVIMMIFMLIMIVFPFMKDFDQTDKM